MACLRKTCHSAKNSIKTLNIVCQIRHGHHLRGKNPDVARSLKQRIDEISFKDPALHFKVDIGFPRESVSRSKELFRRLESLKQNRTDSNLEKLARDKKLSIDLNDVKREWLVTAGPYQIKKIAEHYGIYEHLFGDAYFIPRVPLNILYEKNDYASPVYYGNIIKPADATEKPVVTYESDKDSLWTLVLTNPDGHLTKENSEYCHWFVSNIPGNDITKGETLMNYLQPFPPKGTGYHRFIFILYKQTEELRYPFKLSNEKNLEERTFSTLKFYRERQDKLTPAGLAFFQSDWDGSLTDFYHNQLNMLEPIFEYDFPAAYNTPQKWFPLKMPFNLYMDKYKDSKRVSERYFKDKLKEIHPFQQAAPKLPFPNAEPIPHHIPSWLKLEITKKRLGWGRVNDV